jgi:SH3-like domain-containing protein
MKLRVTTRGAPEPRPTPNTSPSLAAIRPPHRGGNHKVEGRTDSGYDSPDGKSAVTAKLQAGVVAQVRRCKDSWFRIIGTHRKS